MERKRSSSKNEGLVVKVTPGARENRIVGFEGGYLKIKVNAVAEDGKASIAVIELLAEKLGVAKSKVVLISGGTQRIKRFDVKGVTLEQLEERLRRQS